MYQVIIIEDDPMVAAIDKQYVEADSQFRVVRPSRAAERLWPICRSSRRI